MTYLRRHLLSNWLLYIEVFHTVSCLTTLLVLRKYIVMGPFTFSVAALIAPIAIFSGLWLDHYTQLPVRRAIIKKLLAHSWIAAFFYVTNAFTHEPNSLISERDWQALYNPLPSLAMGWGISYSVLQGVCLRLLQKRSNQNFSFFLTGLLISILLLAYIIVQLCPPGSYPKDLVKSVFEKSMFVSACFLAVVGVFFGLLSRKLKFTFNHPLPSALAPRRTTIYTLLCSLFWNLLLITNVITIKWISLGGYLCTAGILTYPCTFMITDLLAELYGQALAKLAVWGGFIANWVMTLTLLLIGYIPCAPSSPIQASQFYVAFGFTPALFFASMVAYLLAQFTDIYLFVWLKAYTQGRHLWLRNNVATILSELLDTITFGCTFWFLCPYLFTISSATNHSWGAVFNLTRNEYGVKVILAFVHTPLVYGLRRMLLYCRG